MPSQMRPRNNLPCVYCMSHAELQTGSENRDNSEMNFLMLCPPPPLRQDGSNEEHIICFYEQYRKLSQNYPGYPLLSREMSMMSYTIRRKLLQRLLLYFGNKACRKWRLINVLSTQLKSNVHQIRQGHVHQLKFDVVLFSLTITSHSERGAQSSTTFSLVYQQNLSK